jgi:hypothetical protein
VAVAATTAMTEVAVVTTVAVAATIGMTEEGAVTTGIRDLVVEASTAMTEGVANTETADLMIAMIGIIEIVTIINTGEIPKKIRPKKEWMSRRTKLQLQTRMRL